MKKVYRYDKSWCGVSGWLLVFTAQSFSHACKVAKELTEQTGKPHCVNN
jgi:hypothetical protein